MPTYSPVNKFSYEKKKYWKIGGKLLSETLGCKHDTKKQKRLKSLTWIYVLFWNFSWMVYRLELQFVTRGTVPSWKGQQMALFPTYSLFPTDLLHGAAERVLS